MDVAAIHARAQAAAIVMSGGDPRQFGKTAKIAASAADAPALLSALEAAVYRAEVAEAALGRVRDTEPTDRGIDATLIPLGFHPDTRYPEYSHNDLRTAYREGWEDAITAADAAVRGDVT